MRKEKKIRQKEIDEPDFFDFDGQDGIRLGLIIFFFICALVNYYQALSASMMWIAAENLKQRGFPFYLQVLHLLQEYGFEPQVIPRLLLVGSISGSLSTAIVFYVGRKEKLQKWKAENIRKRIKKR